MAAEEFLFVRRWRGDYLKAAGVHRAGCDLVPKDLPERSGNGWTVDEIPRSEVSRSVAWAANQGIKAQEDCGSCGGSA